MNYLRRLSILAIAAATAFAGTTFSAFSQDYPDRPIKLVVASGAGGSTDTAARIMAINIQDHLGQPVIIVNKSGGSGSIGINFGLKADADGYTLMEGMIGGHVLHPAMNASSGYTPDDYTPIAMTQMNPNVLVVSASSQYQNLDDLLAKIKSDPGALSFSHAGAGSIHFFGIHQLLKASGAGGDAAVAVPYKGGSKSMAGLLRGEVDFHQTNLVSAFDFIKTGAVRALAVTTKERLEEFPDVPTYTELGYPAVNIFGWRGVIGPKDLPQQIVDKWSKAVQETMERKGWKKMVAAVGDIARYMGPEEFKAHIEQEFSTYREMATELGILVE
jgi:tripartite-type tricarboxylate transporter receptor subunit TctC